MKPPVIARSGSEIAAEAMRLRQFQEAYADLEDTLSDGGPLGDVAAGGAIFGAWVLGETPALSECLQESMRGAIQKTIRPTDGAQRD